MIIAGNLSLTMIRGCTFDVLEIQTLDANGDPVDLTGFTVYAEVRATPGGAVIIDLAPTITDAANGKVTIAEIDDETTFTYTPGSYRWDFLLEETATDNMQKFLEGGFNIVNKITLS